MKFFPRFFLLYFLVFHIYFFSYSYGTYQSILAVGRFKTVWSPNILSVVCWFCCSGFSYLALMTTAAFMQHLILYFWNRFEVININHRDFLFLLFKIIIASINFFRFQRCRGLCRTGELNFNSTPTSKSHPPHSSLRLSK